MVGNSKKVKFDHDMEKASMAIAPGSGLNAQKFSTCLFNLDAKKNRYLLKFERL